MKLSSKTVERLKRIPLLRTTYCWWRIHRYRRLQRANFGKPVDTQSSGKDVWEENVGGEVDFWDSSLAEGRYRDRLNADYLYSPELGLALDRFLPKEKIKAIDVGCGPLSTLGKEYKGMKIERTLVDPLAPKYEPLLERMQVPKEDWPEECEGEALLEKYPAGKYDFVYMCNALDHCHDPFVVVEQLGALVAPGGTLYLEHFENEAEKESYHGLHQWNIYEEGGDLWIANRTVKRSLREILGGQYKISAYPVFRQGGFVVATAARAARSAAGEKV